MPRITSKRVETPDLQGEGSYVVFRRLSWGAAKEARRFVMIGDVHNRADLTVDQIEKMIADEEKLTLELVLNGVLSWNWQDEEGKDLPIPKSTEDLDKMTAEEVQFLVNCCSGNFPGDKQEEKN